MAYRHRCRVITMTVSKAAAVGAAVPGGSNDLIKGHDGER